MAALVKFNLTSYDYEVNAIKLYFFRASLSLKGILSNPTNPWMIKMWSIFIDHVPSAETGRGLPKWCQSANAVIPRKATILAWRMLLKSGCCRAVIGCCSAIQPIRIVHLSRPTTRQPVQCM